MSSSMASNTICVSLKRKTAGWALMPAYNNISLRDSRHSDSPVWERHRHEKPRGRSGDHEDHVKFKFIFHAESRTVSIHGIHFAWAVS